MRQLRGKKRREMAAQTEASTDVAEANTEQISITMEDIKHSLIDASTEYYGSPGPGVANYSWFGGESRPGGFGDTKLYLMDYWTLRQRSVQLFTDNIYAKGLIRRFVTNVINKGLSVEARPEESALGLEEDSLQDWSDEVETNFTLWGSTPSCDYKGRYNWGRMQANIYRKALVEGDVLVIYHVRGNGMMKVELVDSACINNPPGEYRIDLNDGHYIEWGVEFDSKNREVAYWVQEKTLEWKRVPAVSRRTGRRVSKLVRGFDGLTNGVRGEPMLGILLQSLRELDRYRDATLRKAVMNAIIAVFIKKGENKLGSLPLTGGAKRRGSVEEQDQDGSHLRSLRSHVPGLVLEELQMGEEPVVHQSGADINASEFEAAIMHAMAWGLEMPPEIAQLAFSSNYSASQAATNEWKMFLDMARTRFADEALQEGYQEWMLTESFAGRLRRGMDVIEAFRTRKSDYRWYAWVKSDWSGAIKPSTDLLKMAKAYKEMIDEGLIDRERAARELNGVKYDKVVKRLVKQNIALAEAKEPLVELEQQPQTEVPESEEMTTDVVVNALLDGTIDIEVIEEALAEVK